MTAGAGDPLAAAQVALARVEALIELRRYDEALSVLARAARADPGSAVVWAQQARCLLQLGRTKDALAAADSAAAHDPYDEWVHRVRSAALAAAGHRGAAVAAARQAVRLAPTSPWALACLATILGTRREALATAERLVQLEPALPMSHEVLARVALARGDVPLAEGAFRHALSLDPDDPDLVTGLAAVLSRQKRLAEARQANLAALRLDPSSPAARRSLGRLPPAMAALVGALFAQGVCIVESVEQLAGSGPARARLVPLFALVVMPLTLLVTQELVQLRIPPTVRAALAVGRSGRVGEGLLTIGGAALGLAPWAASGWLTGRVNALLGAALAGAGSAAIWLGRHHRLRRWRLPDTLFDRPVDTDPKTAAPEEDPRWSGRPADPGTGRHSTILEGQPTVGQRATRFVVRGLFLWLWVAFPAAMFLAAQVWAAGRPNGPTTAGLIATGAIILAVAAVPVAAEALINDWLWDRLRPARWTPHRHVLRDHATGAPLGPGRTMARGLLRTLLTPVLLILAVRYRRVPRRLPHDRAVNSIVVRLRPATRYDPAASDRATAHSRSP